MQQIPEDYCAGFMEDVRNRVTCDWCKHPKEPAKPKSGLCGHCNRIRLGLEKLEAHAEPFIRERGGIPHDLDWALRVQRAMADGCKTEGRVYGRLFDEDFNDTKLEHEFRFIGKRVTGKDLFFGISNALNYSLSLNQRRYVFYLLSLMSREYHRQHRRGHAQYEVATGDAG
jgi:hypothetical protein